MMVPLSRPTFGRWVGQNLLQSQHQEFNAYPQSPVTYVPRGVYGTVEYRR